MPKRDLTESLTTLFTKNQIDLSKIRKLLLDSGITTESSFEKESRKLLKDKGEMIRALIAADGVNEKIKVAAQQGLYNTFVYLYLYEGAQVGLSLFREHIQQTKTLETEQGGFFNRAESGRSNNTTATLHFSGGGYNLDLSNAFTICMKFSSYSKRPRDSEFGWVFNGKHLSKVISELQENGIPFERNCSGDEVNASDEPALGM